MLTLLTDFFYKKLYILAANCELPYHHLYTSPISEFSSSDTNVSYIVCERIHTHSVVRSPNSFFLHPSVGGVVVGNVSLSAAAAALVAEETKVAAGVVVAAEAVVVVSVAVVRRLLLLLY